MTKELGKTGMMVFPVAYGGIVSMEDGQASSDYYVSWAVDRGVNYFDVAPTYGDAQEKLGNSLMSYRKNLYLACKTTCRMKTEAEKEFQESLRFLHTDYFDNYQMHALQSVGEVETAFAPGGVMELMIKLKKEGYVRNLGITCHNEDAALKALSLYDFDTVLFPLNWHMNIGYGFGTRIAKAAREKQAGLLGMKALIERAWHSKEEKQASSFTKSWCKPIDVKNEKLRVAAMKYALSLGADILIPPGDFANFSFAVEHMEECLESPLNEQDLAYLRLCYESVKEFPFFNVQ